MEITQKGLRIHGTGFCLPGCRVTNSSLETILDTSDAWIASRTGIHARHFLKEGSVVDLAEKAARQALERAQTSPASVDLVIFATLSAQDRMPAAAFQLKTRLHLSDEVMAFDLNAACSGFLYALICGLSLLEPGQKALIIGAEVLSRHLDWTDRSTAVLFGDGAGAVLIEKVPGTCSWFYAASQDDIQPVLSITGPSGRALPAFAPARKTVKEAGADETEAKKPAKPPVIAMDGPRVFRFAVWAMVQASQKVLKQAGLEPQDISLWICHQANSRILDYAARQLGISRDKLFINLDECGNTSAASIAIALAQADQAGRLGKGMKIMAVGFGGGLSYGALCFEW